MCKNAKRNKVQPSLLCTKRFWEPEQTLEARTLASVSSPASFNAPVQAGFPTKGSTPTHIVGDAKRQQSNDKDQEQHPPEAQILYKLLPCGTEAGQDPLTLLQVGIEERMAFHGTVREAKGKKGHETTRRPFQKQKTRETALFKKTNLKIYIDEKKTDIYILNSIYVLT